MTCRVENSYDLTYIGSIWNCKYPSELWYLRGSNMILTKDRNIKVLDRKHKPSGKLVKKSWIFIKYKEFLYSQWEYWGTTHLKHQTGTSNFHHPNYHNTLLILSPSIKFKGTLRKQIARFKVQYLLTHART